MIDKQAIPPAAMIHDVHNGRTRLRVDRANSFYRMKKAREQPMLVVQIKQLIKPLLFVRED